MNSDSIRDFLKSDYDRSEWRNFLKAIFPTAEIFATPKKLESTNERIPDGWQLGRVMLADGKRIAIIEQPEPASTKLIRNRVDVRNRVARLIDQESATGVLAVFIQEGNPNFRFSFVARESALVFSENGARTITSETASKRFTYYLGPDEACTTPAQRFEQLYRLGATAELAHLIEAFSVEKLNKEFFTDFSRAVGLVASTIKHKHFHLDENVCRAEAQTLLNRLIFLYFVQRKGWLNRSRSFLKDAFRPHQDREGATFYQTFLSPLFECLSTEPSLAPPFSDDVPFLNGGLFSDEAGAKDLDIQLRRKLDVPNSVFKEVFEGLLERYNFTIIEDSPSSVEVAIDPEMLGQVFEALVLQREESASGGKSRRHDTGSHYTPRPIVHYLCREILAGWLEGRAPFYGQADGRRKIESLLALDSSEGVDEETSSKLQNLLTAEEAEALAAELIRLRMCDPAVGSGAFPLGFLHEMLNLLRLCETRSSGRDPAEGDPAWLYITKKKIIEQVIYGVDLQAEAIELCKLRLWLSLMVDHELKADPFNCSKQSFQKALRQLEPLPNLDFKIRPANSLLDLIHGQRLRLDAGSLPGDSRNHVKGLAEAKHVFYNASKAKEKRNARRAIHTHYAALVMLALAQERGRFTARVRSLDEDDLRQFSAIQAAEKEAAAIIKLLDASKREKSAPLQDQILQQVEERLSDPSKPTFLWPFDFAEVFFPLEDRQKNAPTLRGSLALVNAVAGQMELTMIGNLNPHGFDLMVGNPPYIRIQTLKKEDPELADYYKKRYHSASKGNYDLYVCFVERGLELLHDAGQLGYIIPHKFFNTQYGQPLRHLISNNHLARHIVHFGDIQIFEGASNFVCLLFLAKAGRNDCRYVKVENLNDWYRNQAGKERIFNADFIDDSAWTFTVGAGAKIYELLERSTKNLSDVADIFVGLQTDGDEVYILELESELGGIARCRSKFTGQIHDFEAGHLKRLLKGSLNVRRWHLDDVSKRLIFPYQTLDGKSVLIRNSEYRSRWPLTWKYLETCRERLQQGARKKLGENWHGYVYKKNHTKFEQVKILAPSIANQACFAIDEVGDCFFVGSGGGGGGGYGITIKDGVNLSSRFLISILNSPVSTFFIRQISTTFRGGYMALNRQYIERLPIPVATCNQVSVVERIASWILWLYQHGNDKLATGTNAALDPLIAAYFEQWLNGLVYELYFPEQLHAAQIRLFDLTEKLKLPELTDIPERGRMEFILREFRRLYDENGTLRSALFTLGNLPEVRIIEGTE